MSGTTGKRDRPRLWTGDFTLMLAIAFCAFVSCQALNNGTPLYTTRIGGTTGFAGALILDFSIAAAIARLFAGRIIDRTGRKRIMVVGALLLIAGSVLAIPLPGFYPQIVLRALQGIGFACVTTASATAAADVLPTGASGRGHRLLRARAIAWHGIWSRPSASSLLARLCRESVPRALPVGGGASHPRHVLQLRETCRALARDLRIPRARGTPPQACRGGGSRW